MKKSLLSTFLVQLFMLFFVFGHLFSDPNAYMLQNGDDGLKNYYTLQSYVTQDPDAGYFKYTGMNYPVGDIIWYTDNTPPYAMVMRWIHLNITNVSGAVIPVFHFLIVLNFLLFSLLTFFILYRLKINVYLAVLFAVGLAYINPMSLRIFGHFNLSLSFVFPLMVILLTGLFRGVLAGKTVNIYLLWTGLSIVFMSFIHLYYLALLVSFVFSAMGFFFILYFKKIKAFLFLGVSSVTIFLSSVAVYLTIRITDTFYLIRPETAQGYDWSVWRIKMQDLVTSYFFLTLQPLGEHSEWLTERFVYLGTAFIFLLLFTLIIFSVYKPFRVAISERWTKGSNTHFMVVIFLASVIGFFIAQGEKIHFPFTQMSMANIFNPLYYLGIFTDFFTHFRALGRFTWAFNFVLAILLIYTFQFILKIILNVWLRVLLVLIVSLLVTVDTYNYAAFFKKETKKVNLFSAVDKPDLNYSQFQAILPVPYFQVGNEVPELTFDDQQEWSQIVFPFAIKSGLPLMAAKLSRVPESHSRLIMEIFSDSEMPSELRVLMPSPKPILIMVSEKMNSGDILLKEKSKELIQHERIKFLKSHNGIQYYSWNWSD